MLFIRNREIPFRMCIPLYAEKRLRVQFTAFGNEHNKGHRLAITDHVQPKVGVFQTAKLAGSFLRLVAHHRDQTITGPHAGLESRPILDWHSDPYRAVNRIALQVQSDVIEKPGSVMRNSVHVLDLGTSKILAVWIF